MSDTKAATIDQWMQFYQQPLMDAQILVPSTEGFSDSTVMTTSPTMPSSESNILSLTSGHLTPKGNMSKPIKRRSRASKRTPTTLLNANTTNFRALVQQFTGCPSTTMSSLGVHKGPITLNFQQGTNQQIHTNTITRTMPPLGSRGYDQVQQVAAAPLPWQKQPDQLPQQQFLQEQQGAYFLSTPGNSRPSLEVSDGLMLDNDFSLHDLTVNAFPSDTY